MIFSFAATGAGIEKGGRGRAHTERGHEAVVHQVDQVARAIAQRQPEGGKQARGTFAGVRARLHASRTTASGRLGRSLLCPGRKVVVSTPQGFAPPRGPRGCVEASYSTLRSVQYPTYGTDCTVYTELPGARPTTVASIAVTAGDVTCKRTGRDGYLTKLC